MFSIFRRKISVAQAAKRLAEWNAMKDRQRIHAQCDRMREQLGLPPVDWEKLA